MKCFTPSKPPPTKISWRQQISLQLLRPASHRQRLDLLAIQLIRHRNLHFHLHGLQHAEGLPSLENVSHRDTVRQQLPWHDARNLVRIPWCGLLWSRLCRGTDHGIRIRS